MTAVRQTNEVIFDEKSVKMEHVRFTPRCSTPFFDRCVGSRPAYYVCEERAFREREKNAEYREWKKSLQRPKPRHFKVRGGNQRNKKNPILQKLITGGGSTDSSMISGHFEAEPVIGAREETPAVPPPVYQMWFPVAYPGGFWTTATNYHGQNPACHGMPFQQQTQFQTAGQTPPAFFDHWVNHQGAHGYHGYNHQIPRWYSSTCVQNPFFKPDPTFNPHCPNPSSNLQSLLRYLQCQYYPNFATYSSPPMSYVNFPPHAFPVMMAT